MPEAPIFRFNSQRASLVTKTVKRVIGYFHRNLSKMAYADFRAQGLPIGSGPVEAACKTVVNARLKRSGMRWTRVGGQRVLNLRTHVLSKRWDVFGDTYMGMGAKPHGTAWKRTHTPSWHRTCRRCRKSGSGWCCR